MDDLDEDQQTEIRTCPGQISIFFFLRSSTKFRQLILSLENFQNEAFKNSNATARRKLQDFWCSYKEVDYTYHQIQGEEKENPTLSKLTLQTTEMSQEKGEEKSTN